MKNENVVLETADTYVKIIDKVCDMCGKPMLLLLTEEQQAQYDEYLTGLVYGRRELIQNVLLDFDKFEREFVKTGYCPCCQEKIFQAKFKGKAHKWIALDEETVPPEKYAEFYESVHESANAKLKAGECFDFEQLVVSFLENETWKQKLSVDEKASYLYLIGVESFRLSGDGHVSMLDEESCD